MVYEFEYFEWDEIKAARNILKHGFDFNDAAQVFIDQRHVNRASFKHGEIRFKTTGFCNEQLVTVIHTPRGQACRIISVRHARKKEEEEYYGNS